MKPNLSFIFGLLLLIIVFMSGCAPQELDLEKEEIKVPAVLEVPVEPTIEIEEAIESPTEIIIPDKPITEEEEPQSLFPGGTVLYQQDDVTFEHYFPNTGSLKSDESEILIYNQGTLPIQITASDMKFIVAGRTYEQYSGTWEKFPSQQSWERMEQVNIKPSSYNGQPVVLEPGQKGKLHWHYQFEGDIQRKEQKVKISVKFKIGTVPYNLNKEVTRQNPGPKPSEEGHGESNSEGGQEVSH